MRGDGRLGYLRDGTYTVEVTSVEVGTRFGDSKRYAAIEFTVLESSNPQVLIGDHCIHTVLMTGKRAVTEVLGIAAALGYEGDYWTIAKALKALAADSVDGSLKARVRAKVSSTKDGRSFARLQWSPIGGLD